MVEAYEYNAYGKATVFTGDGSDNTWFTDDDDKASWSAVANPYQYTGQRYDPETGWMYYKYRYYDTELGRFVSRDPVGYVDTLSLYSYVLDNPTNYYDPIGLFGCKDEKAAVASAAARIANLSRTIANVRASIARRLRDLETNPLNLPETHPDDDKYPSKSRRGHRRLIAQDRARVEQLRQQLTNAYSNQRRAQDKLAKCIAREKALKKVCKKAAKSGASKIPVVGLVFFGSDVAHGGLRHAINEQLWPLSEIWK